MDEKQNTILDKAVKCAVELEMKVSSYTEESMLLTALHPPFEL
jgi:hypothetical protein